MATVQRLTKRVKDLEEWVKQNEVTGGPNGVLDAFAFVINEMRANAGTRMQAEQNFQQLRGFSFEFIQQHELDDEWNEFLEEKDKERQNAIQEQSPEEVPSLTEAEDGEEVGEEDTKGKKPSKKSNKEKKD